MIKRRAFLESVVASVGIATIGCDRSSQTKQSVTSQGATSKPASPTTTRQVTKVTNMHDFNVIKGPSKGLFMTFEGLCAVVLPQQDNDPIRVGLLAGHRHVASLKLHRDAVSINDTWEPSTGDDDYYLYPLKGLQVNIKGAQGGPVQKNFSPVADQCANDDTSWDNLGWALDVRGDLKGTGALKKEWWKDPTLVDAVFELDRGYVEGGFDGQEPVQFEPNVVKWKLPYGSKRVLKQIVRFRLDMNDVVLEARPLGVSSTPKTLTFRNGVLTYVGVKHFPLGPKRDRFSAGTPLDETKGYYSLIDGFSGNMAVPYAVDKGDDCPMPSTPDCTCCPPGVYP